MIYLKEETISLLTNLTPNDKVLQMIFFIQKTRNDNEENLSWLCLNTVSRITQNEEKLEYWCTTLDWISPSFLDIFIIERFNKKVTTVSSTAVSSSCCDFDFLVLIFLWAHSPLSQWHWRLQYKNRFKSFFSKIVD